MSGRIVLVVLAVKLLLVQSKPTDGPSLSAAKVEDVDSLINQLKQPNYPNAQNNDDASSQSSLVNAYHEDEAELKRQAQNARYQFATQVNDNINGNFQQRAEVREGTKVYGKYSYDDGFAWRTVYYQADENGYRVTKEVVAPSHMVGNIDGDVNVQSFMDGNSINYHITRKDIGSRKQTNQQNYASQQQQYGVARSER